MRNTDPGWTDPALDWVLVWRCRHGYRVTRTEVGTQLAALAQALHHEDGWSANQIAETLGTNRAQIQRLLTERKAA